MDSQGNVIERLPYEQIVTSWDRLHQIMRATIPQGTHHLGYNLKTIEQDADSVTAIFENGERVTGDLLVGADGFRSVVRNMFAPAIQPIYAGYVVWRGLADEGCHSEGSARGDLRQVRVLPAALQQEHRLPDCRTGQRSAAGSSAVELGLVSGRRSEPTLDDMLVDEEGVYHAVSIPPPKVRADVIARLKEDARHFLPPPMRDILFCVSKPFFTPIYDLLVEKMVYGRVALIGDAAAVARPHVGMGIAKAGTDAEVLADSLASHPDLLEGLARISNASVCRSPGRPWPKVAPWENTCSIMRLPKSGADDAHWREFHSIPGILKHTASSAFLRSA